LRDEAKVARPSNEAVTPPVGLSKQQHVTDVEQGQSPAEVSSGAANGKKLPHVACEWIDRLLGHVRDENAPPEE
jgi:hypothetical protein